MQYQTKIENLSEVLNRKRSKGTAQDFRELVKGYGALGVSTKFLMGLIQNRTHRQKMKRISDLVKKSGLRKRKQNRYYKEFSTHQFRATIDEYGLNKWGKVVLKKTRLQDVGKFFGEHKKEVLTFVKC